MHFFGTLGSLSFFAGFAITIYLLWEKQYNLKHHLRVRDVVDQPLFFLSIMVIIIGVQLFLVGFLGEIMAYQNKKEEYIIAEEL